MRYFIYHHKHRGDSFTGMPETMLAEYDEERNMSFYTAKDKTFSLGVEKFGVEKSIAINELEEISTADFAKYLLTVGDDDGNRFRDRKNRIHFK